MAKIQGKPRKVVPPKFAVIRADNCTGCEACIEVCPADCIYKVEGDNLPTVQSFCEIDLERCVGCIHCSTWCPWDAIDLVPTPTIADHVAAKGGPPVYVEEQGPDLVKVAREQVEKFEKELAAKKQPAKK